MDIRIATGQDIPAITEIYNQAIALKYATADLSPVTEEARSRWLAGHSPDTHPVYVADKDGQVIGYCSISPYRPGRMALNHTKEISYYVHQDFRAQGIGSELVKHAIDLAPSLGIKTLFAIMLDKNPNSLALLQKFRFEQWGFMPKVADFDGEEVGHYYYGLRLPNKI
ncbi:MAG: GNAT family N-acetyltransferase [Gammaproteobacteria bacterium]|nr:GNAT family N-acetyltransferase [Gammaproteobacteria bacterium]